MNEIKWIKLTTDMFDNRKIKAIRKMPEGNNIILIWVMLLTLAGRCNAGGLIFLTENIKYDLNSLADELDFEANIVNLALRTLQRFGMIVFDESEFYISNWEEYQNTDGMERIREQAKLRTREYRERKKQALLISGDVTRDVTVTSRDGTDIDKEKDKELDIKENVKRKTFKPPTFEEVESYCKERGNNVNPQRFIDYYQSNGWMVGKNRMKDWKASVRTWEQRDGFSMENKEEMKKELPSSIRRN